MTSSSNPSYPLRLWVKFGESTRHGLVVSAEYACAYHQSRHRNLADTQSRGSLDVVDFTIGMHLIQHTMNGSLPALPAVLNPSLYASAASLPLPQQQPGSPITNVQQQSRLGAGPGSPLRQGSLPVQQQQQPQFGGYSSPQQQQSSAPWDISAQDKRESDGYFDGIDTTRKGTIEGEAAVAFFMQSGLGMDVLARVW